MGSCTVDKRLSTLSREYCGVNKKGNFCLPVWDEEDNTIILSWQPITVMFSLGLYVVASFYMVLDIKGKLDHKKGKKNLWETKERKSL